MVSRRFHVAAFLAAALAPSGAQSEPAFELDVTGGFASQRNTTALATQLRLFGATTTDLRYALEVSWADGGPRPTDAFSSSYPYDHRWTVMEAYVDQPLRLGPLPARVRMGQFRPPFGFYDRSEHAYTGFLRAPLLRYPGYWGLNNYWTELGVGVFAGVPALSFEGAVGTPQEHGGRPHRGTDLVGRIQTAQGDLILGASYVRTLPEAAYFFATGGTWFLGLDARWAREGWQLRGEYLTGVPHSDTETRAWYLDLSVHRPWMGPVTAVARYEGLSYFAGPFSSSDHRLTVGARSRLGRNLTVAVNLVHQPSGLPGRSNTSGDVGVTYSVRR